LNRVVGQLLEFSRPVSIVARPVQLERWLADALALVEPQVRARGIRVQTDLRLSPGQALVDPDRLNQVLLNLLLNAVEAMEPGGTLTVGLEETGGGQLEIRVSDTGCGIRPEDMAHIFEPYFTTRANGTGLGLAIAHNITEAMGGAVSAVSTPGRGTTFTVTVPLSAAGRERLRGEE
jgi:two-component system sensor histidine kinase HydH